MRKILNARGGFSLIELIIAMVVIGILAGVLVPYTFRNQDKARETGVQNSAHAIQTGLGMYASDRKEYPWYPTTISDIVDTSTGLASLVNPAPRNPFNGYGYLEAGHIKEVGGSETTFYLGTVSSSATVSAGVIEYRTDGNSYTLILYGAKGVTLPLQLTSRH